MTNTAEKLTLPLFMVKYNGDLLISTGRSRFETSWKNKTMSWAALLNKLSRSMETTETHAEYMKMSKEQQDKIKDIGGFVGGHLRDGRRKTGYVTARQLLTLDLDFPPAEFWDNIIDNLEIDNALAVYSTHKHTNAPVVVWCRKMEKRPDCIHVHVDYRDVPPEWLGAKLIEAAEILHEVDERQWRWLWLGLSIGVDELIYYMFGDAAIQRPSRDHYRIIGIGVDYGQQNATTYQAAGLNEYEHKLDGLAEYYHSGRETGTQKSPSEYAGDFVKFLNLLHETYSCSYFYTFIDPSARGLMEEIKRATRGIGYNVLIRDAENDVALGISRVQKLLTFKMMTVSPDQENAVREFGLYEYDKKSIERGREEPVKQDDHGMDAIRYLVMGMWSKIKNYLPVRDKEEEPEGAIK